MVNLSNITLDQIVNKETLSPLVRQIYNNTAFEIHDWKYKSLSGGSTMAGVYRISGIASDDGQSIEWSIILKHLPSPSRDNDHILAPTENPASSNYWKREFLVYSSGLLDHLPNGFTSPRCYLAEEQEDACLLWLEDVGNMGASEWSHERFGLAAYHLGLFNGMGFSNLAMPSFDWLNNSFVCDRAFVMDITAHKLPAMVASFCQVYPTMTKIWSEKTISASQQLLADRELFLQKLDQLPKTFQHQDTSQKNLMTRSVEQGKDTTVAIDWGFAGLGAIGVDLACLIVSSARWFGDVKPAQLPEVENLALEAYLQGLYEAGWKGDPQIIRLGYLLTSILLFGPIGARLSCSSSERERVGIEMSFHRPFVEVVSRWSEVHQHVLTQADEARTLM